MMNAVAQVTRVDFAAEVRATEIDSMEEWLFRVDCAGPFAPSAEISALIADAPDPDHDMAVYLRSLLDGRHSQIMMNLLA
jgi:hypothetical protein